MYLKRHSIDGKLAPNDDYYHRHGSNHADRGICWSSLHRVTNAKSTTRIAVGSFA
jgi:hypothetical protein